MRLPNRTKRRLVTLAVAWAVSKSKTEAGESLISWVLGLGSWVLAFNSWDLVLGNWCFPPSGFLLSNRSLGKLGNASLWVFGTGVFGYCFFQRSSPRTSNQSSKRIWKTLLCDLRVLWQRSTLDRVDLSGNRGVIPVLENGGIVV